MKCPRCEKEFQFEFPDVQNWLKNSRFDNKQLSYILFNYGGPICEDCEIDLVCGFYLTGVHPRYMKHRK